jgi:hypothetical protein
MKLLLPVCNDFRITGNVSVNRLATALTGPDPEWFSDHGLQPFALDYKGDLLLDGGLSVQMYN